MRVVCLSDTHNQHFSLSIPDGDVLIHSGDALGRGTYSEAVRFNEWLGTLPHKHKLYVPGNHDELFELNPVEGRNVMTNAIVLIDQGVEIDGVKFYGSPWTKQFYDWAFMKPDQQLREIWDKIPDDTDVLITHGPPWSILDANRRGDLCGSQTLYEAVKRANPAFHIFGHIHESSGVLTIADTTFINAAILDDWYNYGNPPKVFTVHK
jgi:Icc-related predicted phosphoesterase